MDHYGFLLNLKLYFVKYKYGVLFNGNYNKKYKKKCIAWETFLRVCMHCVEVVHTYDNQD